MMMLIDDTSRDRKIESKAVSLNGNVARQMAEPGQLAGQR